MALYRFGLNLRPVPSSQQVEITGTDCVRSPNAIVWVSDLLSPAGHTAVLAGTIDENSREMLLLISAKRLFKAAAETSRD